MLMVPCPSISKITDTTQQEQERFFTILPETTLRAAGMNSRTRYLMIHGISRTGHQRSMGGLDFGYRDPKVPMPDRKPSENGIPKISNNDWGAIPGKEEKDYGDVQIVNFARDFLARDHEKPFFLAMGTYRPHVPLHVPQKYFDMYPLDSIVLPVIKEDDLDDVPEEGKKLAMEGNNVFVENTGVREIQGSLAGIPGMHNLR